jgi:hypothetical protein
MTTANKWMIAAPLSLLLMITNYGSLAAAGPITHAYLAERFLDYFPLDNPGDIESFMLGTLFPDIRYIAKIDRAKTHYEGITLDAVINEPSPFIAGMKFHSWVDDRRSSLFRNNYVYDALPKKLDTKAKVALVKLIEDQIVFGMYNGRHCRRFLHNIIQEELEWGIAKSDVNKWHDTLLLYFKLSPANIVSLLSLYDVAVIWFTREDASYWSDLIEASSHQDPFQEHVTDLLNHLETLIREELCCIIHHYTDQPPAHVRQARLKENHRGHKEFF